MRPVVYFLFASLIPITLFSTENAVNVRELDQQANKLLKKEQFDEGINLLNQSLAEDAQNVRAYRLRANAYFAKGDYDQAIADFTKIITLLPENGKAFLDRGMAYLAKGDRLSAADDIKKGLLEDKQLLNDLKSHPEITKVIRELLEEQDVKRRQVAYKNGVISSKKGDVRFKQKGR